jgi:hypothetical protein
MEPLPLSERRGAAFSLKMLRAYEADAREAIHHRDHLEESRREELWCARRSIEGYAARLTTAMLIALLGGES